MKRKDYEKPTMLVVQLQQQYIICTSPGGLNDPTDYEDGGDPFSSSAPFADI